MIITESTRLKDKMSLNKIIIIDDINSKNKEEIFSIIDNCDLYITDRFPMPTNNNEIIGKKSDTIRKINEKLTIVSNDVINHKSTMFSNETQFKNFKIKILFWCAGLFKDIVTKLDEGSTELVIVINSKVSKHEYELVKWFSEIGVKFLIISSTLESLVKPEDRAAIINFNTKENIQYTNENRKNTIVKSGSNSVCKKYNTLDIIEKALYDNNETVKVIVSGTDTYIDTCNFYAKLNKYCDKEANWILANQGFPKPSYEDTSAIPRFSNNNTEYILHTLCNFIKAYVTDKDVITNIIKDLMTTGENKGLSSQMIYNKVVYAVCVINKLYINVKPRCIVFYGEANKNDTILLEIINRIPDISLIIACSDKEKAPRISDMSLLELKYSNDIFPIPLIDKRDEASTIAAQAQQRVNQTLYSGDTLGMYKPGQFRTCKVINFNTTYDEIKMWWNKETYIRPGFEANGDIAVIPTIFRVIKGVNGDEHEYLKEVQKYCCGKTVICKEVAGLSELYNYGESCKIHRGTDINGTRFEDQKPFFENGKLNKDRIMHDINYKYAFIDYNKQQTILDKIEDILVNNKVNEKLFNSKQDFIDTVLNVCLNLNIHILQLIQWFEYYTYNPNLVVIIKDQNMPDIKNMIVLALLQNLGFDVLIFVPTSYSSIENLIGPKFVYDTNIIGEAKYNIDISSLHLTDNIEIEVEDSDNKKKQGFFSKLFGK